MVQGESNASYLARTATANGLELPRLLKALHQERLPRNAADVLPARQEVMVSAEAMARLSGLVERDGEQLQRSLPGLQAEKLLDAAAGTVRIIAWPKEPGAAPLKACPLCVEEGAWLVAAGRRWRPCGCGRRWQCGDDGGISSTPHRSPTSHTLSSGTGPSTTAWDRPGTRSWPTRTGDAVVVGLQASRPGGVAGAGERTAVGPRLRRRQAAPAVVYPEAVDLAEAMDQ
ncbi:hypothetical protein STSP_66980 [Streptomyces jeddahensis]|uniref:TniQ domain-containing protein n=2 Tax=Streptomyces jeddahensis TaxID=1716141 RepID=A0A177HFY8_9ACTN|nr:hypothetical protein STSP_66980 [Streptomyces jeddahensis]